MQSSEREGCGPEASPSVMPEAPLESPPAPAKSPAKSPTFDLFNLVLSYKRLEIYLEPLKDAGDGVRYLLRYRLGRVALTCWLPGFLLCSCAGHLGSGWAVLSALVKGHWAFGLVPGPLCLGPSQERQALGTIWPFTRVCSLWLNKLIP